VLEFHSLFFLPYGLWRIEMNEDDLRDCFAMFAMNGIIITSNDVIEKVAKDAYRMADAMIEARKQKESRNEEDSGIAAVVPKRSRKR
jgi:hypothetical protein